MEAATPTELAAGLQAAEYLADDGLSVALFLALSMHLSLIHI